MLKPGGRLYMEEVFRAFLSRPFCPRLLDRSQRDHFEIGSFRDALTATGFEVLAAWVPWGMFGLLVARRPDGRPPGARLQGER